jgi:hypothetical protein
MNMPLQTYSPGLQPEVERQDPEKYGQSAEAGGCEKKRAKGHSPDSSDLQLLLWFHAVAPVG